jgi:hypothetical protein
MGVRTAFVSVCCCCLVLAAFPVLAADDDDWGDESGWDELDDPSKAPKAGEDEYPPMVMAPETLPPGYVGIRGSAGLLFSSLGLHVGLTDWLDVIADGYMPYEDVGNTWMFGGGLKFRIHGKRGDFQYCLKLKGYGVYYDDPSQASAVLPKGFGIWPAFMIGMNVKGGSFYGEIGALVFPWVADDSNVTRIFQGIPAHFGGEIYVTDWFHVFINVDILLAWYTSVFAYHLTGPFNMLEVGVVFLL